MFAPGESAREFIDENRRDNVCSFGISCLSADASFCSLDTSLDGVLEVFQYISASTREGAATVASWRGGIALVRDADVAFARALNKDTAALVTESGALFLLPADESEWHRADVPPLERAPDALVIGGGGRFAAFAAHATGVAVVARTHA